MSQPHHTGVVMATAYTTIQGRTSCSSPSPRLYWLDMSSDSCHSPIEMTTSLWWSLSQPQQTDVTWHHRWIVTAPANPGVSHTNSTAPGILGLVLDLGHGNLCPLKRILISAETAVLRLRTSQEALRITVTGHGIMLSGTWTGWKGQRGVGEGCRQRLGKCQALCVLAALVQESQISYGSLSPVQNLSQSQGDCVHGQVWEMLLEITNGI